jgi:putative lysine transport system permease protein
MLLHGIATTVELAIFGTAIAFVLALLLVFLRIQTPDRCDNYLVRFFKVLGSGFAKVYSTIIRGTPMMVQGLIIYYGIFGIFRSTGMTAGEVQEVWSFFVAGLVTLSLCSAAYMAEVLRASIEAIDPGQLEAARSLGLSQWQGMKDIVFPQGVKNAIPALSNELIINIKDSSVLSVVGVFDLMYATTSIAGIYFRQMELYVTAALIYLCLTLVASRILSGISARRGMRTRSILSTASENESVPVGGGLIAHE